MMDSGSGTIVTTLTSGQKISYVQASIGLMTGQEFYDRFKSEFKDIIIMADSDGLLNPLSVEKEVLVVAKRAAGL